MLNIAQSPSPQPLSGHKPAKPFRPKQRRTRPAGGKVADLSKYTPLDALPGHVRDRKARPHQHHINACARTIVATLTGGNQRQAGYARTVGNLVSQWARKRLDGFDEATISARGIAKATGQSERSVYRHIAQLAQDGIHINECSALGGRHAAAVRGIDWPVLLQKLATLGLKSERKQANLLYGLNSILKHMAEPLFLCRKQAFEGAANYDTKPFGVIPYVVTSQEHSVPVDALSQSAALEQTDTLDHHGQPADHQSNEGCASTQRSECPTRSEIVEISDLTCTVAPTSLDPLLVRVQTKPDCIHHLGGLHRPINTRHPRACTQRRTKRLQIAVRPTMTTREIADLTGKKHFIVLRDTRNMLEKLGLGGAYRFVCNYLHDQNKERIEYRLPKDLTLTLVSGYDVALGQGLTIMALGTDSPPIGHCRQEPRGSLLYVGKPAA